MFEHFPLLLQVRLNLRCNKSPIKNLTHEVCDATMLNSISTPGRKNFFRNNSRKIYFTRQK